MNLLVDTSVWSLAFRRDSTHQAARDPHVTFLGRALEDGDAILTTGLILQELLQGFSGPKAPEAIVERFDALPILSPDRRDHIEAAELRNRCRRGGVQIGTIDALIAQLAIRHTLTLLTTDRDFERIAAKEPLTLWRP